MKIFPMRVKIILADFKCLSFSLFMTQKPVLLFYMAIFARCAQRQFSISVINVYSICSRKDAKDLKSAHFIAS